MTSSKPCSAGASEPDPTDAIFGPVNRYEPARIDGSLAVHRNDVAVLQQYFCHRTASPPSRSGKGNAFNFDFEPTGQLHAAGSTRRRICGEKLPIHPVHVVELEHVVKQDIDLDDFAH